MNPREQKIILFKGEAQYGVTNRFIEDMENAYKKDGQRVITFDLRDSFESMKDQLIEEMSKERPLFALGFNAVGQFYVKDQSVYDMVAFPHISWMVDHPVHHIDRIEIPADQKYRELHVPDNFGLIATIDKGHKQFIDISFAQKYGCFFLPHGGCKARKVDMKTRNLDLVFCGTGTGPESIRNTWKKMDPKVKELIETAVEIDESGIELSSVELIAKVFTEHSESPNRKRFMLIMHNVERYRRAKERLQTLEALDHAGIKTTLFGRGWEFAKFRNHEIKKELSFEDTLEVFQQSKLSLNASSFFKEGAHERIFSSMLNGAVCLTNGSKYLDGLDGFYDVEEKYDHLDSLPEIVDNALDNTELQDKAIEGCSFVEKGHTFGHRAIELRDTIHTAMQ